MMQRVFISRSPEQVQDVIQSLQADRIECDARSLIQTSSLHFEMPSYSPNWIFFFSSNAVIHFFDQEPKLNESIKFGALGESTAATLRQFREVTYCGTGNDTSAISKDFAALLGNGTVLLPQSQISLRPLQAFLKEGQYVDLVCYKTELVPLEVPEADVMVFSSPSNVQSYFSSNALPKRAGIISFGPATSKALRKFGTQPSVELQNLSPENIVRAIKSLLCSSEVD